MLIGLALLAIGVALLGYVVTARQPTPADGPSAFNKLKSSAPGPRVAHSGPAAVEPEESGDMDETLVMRVHSSLSNAVLDPLSEQKILPATPVAVPTWRCGTRSVDIVITVTDGVW